MSQQANVVNSNTSKPTLAPSPNKYTALQTSDNLSEVSASVAQGNPPAAYSNNPQVSQPIPAPMTSINGQSMQYNYPGSQQPNLNNFGNQNQPVALSNVNIIANDNNSGPARDNAPNYNNQNNNENNNNNNSGGAPGDPSEPAIAIDPVTGKPIEDKNLMDIVSSRDWFLLFLVTILFVFIGIMIYIGTNKHDAVLYCTVTGFAIAYTIDYFLPDEWKEMKVWTHGRKKHQIEPDFNEKEFVKFPIRSDFYDRYGKLAGSCIIYEYGTSNVKRDRKLNNLKNGIHAPGAAANVNEFDEHDIYFEHELRLSGLNPQFNSNNAGNQDITIKTNNNNNNDEKEEKERELLLSKNQKNNDSRSISRSTSNDFNVLDKSETMSKVSKMGDDRTLIIRIRNIYSQQKYQGYETGGGIGGIIGIIADIVLVIARYASTGDTGGLIEDELLPDSWFDTTGSQIASFGFLSVFVLFLCTLVGCVFEIELRKQNWLYPLGWSTEEIKWFPIYEITNWNYFSFGYYFRLDTNRPQGEFNRYAYYAFKGIFGTIRIIVKFIELFFIILTSNPAFACFLVLTIALATGYYAHVQKKWDALIATLIFSGITFFTSLLGGITTTPGDSCNCGKCSCDKITGERIVQVKQTIFSVCFFISCILLIVCVGLTIYIIDDYGQLQQINTLEVKPGTIWNSTTCQDYFTYINEYTTNETSNVSITPSPTEYVPPPTPAPVILYNGESIDEVFPLCAQYDELVGVLVLITLLWFSFWFMALLWHFIDTQTLNLNLDNDSIARRQSELRFEEYTKFSITRRIYGDLEQKTYLTTWTGAWWTWLFGRSDHKTEDFYININTAIQLNKYLLRVTRIQRFNKSILINPWLPYTMPATGRPNINPNNISAADISLTLRVVK